MIRQTITKHVNRSAKDTFSVIGTGLYEYHPKWEREVVEIRPLTAEPVGVGSRAIMVRREFGRTTESEYEITEFEQDHKLAAYHPDDPSMDFHISFQITPIDDDSCTVQVDVEAQPKGWSRLFEPVMRLAMPGRTERLASSMVEVIESAPALT
ncbi:MAG: SRPBCC family protein [Acidimicrobiia bacterium]